VFFSMLIRQTDFFSGGHGDLGSPSSPKKFFSIAISTSFQPTICSRLAIFSFFSFSLVFQPDTVTG